MKPKRNSLFILLALFFSFSTVNAQTSFGDQNIIIQLEAYNAQSVYATDLDGDGDQDVLSSSNDEIAWYENIDGNGNFGAHVVTTATINHSDFLSVYAADIDGDGDQDILSVFYEGITWYENTDGNGNFGSFQVIGSVWYPYSVYAADINGDGVQDVLSASDVLTGYDYISWYGDVDGNGIFEVVVAKNREGAFRDVYAADIDGDGDQDVLSASRDDDIIAWYENTNGIGNFGAQQIITTSVDGARSVYATDLDGDGDQDVLSASSYDSKIAWYENTDGWGTFGAQQIITTSADGARSVYATDLDGDGDQDVLSASYNDGKIAWYENTDGIGNFGAQQIITTSADGARSVYATDLDGDGDQDVLSASYNDGKIAWYENLTTVSIKTLFQNEISIYPNPTNGKLNFIFADNIVHKLTVSDITGKQIIEKTQIVQNETIDLTGFEIGIYIISILTDEGIFTSKIVKK